MPTTILKTGAKTADPAAALKAAAEKLKAAHELEAKSPQEMTDAELADELGQARAEIEALVSSIQQREEELISEAKARSKTAAPSKEYRLKGSKFAVIFSKPALTRKITSVADVLLAIGEERFLDICSVKISDLDKVLSKDEQKSKGLVEEVPGNRKMTVEEV